MFSFGHETNLRKRCPTCISNTALQCSGTTIAEKQVQLKILELPNSSRNGFASVTIVDVLGGLL